MLVPRRRELGLERCDQGVEPLDLDLVGLVGLRLVRELAGELGDPLLPAVVPEQPGARRRICRVVQGGNGRHLYAGALAEVVVLDGRPDGGCTDAGTLRRGEASHPAQARRERNDRGQHG